MVIKGISSSISPPLHQHMQPHTHTKVQRTGTSTSSQVHESDTTCKSPYAYQMFASTKTVDRKFNTKAIPQQKNKKIGKPTSTKLTHTRVWKEMGLR